MPRFGAELLKRLVEVAVEVNSSRLAGDDQWLMVDPALVPELRGPVAATVDTTINTWRSRALPKH